MPKHLRCRLLWKNHHHAHLKVRKEGKHGNEGNKQQQCNNFTYSLKISPVGNTLYIIVYISSIIQYKLTMHLASGL